MKALKSKTSRLLALTLVVALTQGYAQAALPRPYSAPSAAGKTVRQALQGRLTTQGDSPITVNGNSAKSGETIFSGQQLQTPAGTGATVDLGQLGRLEISSSSDVTLTFEEGKINVVVVRGCVTLTANKGVTGTVQANGKTQTTDPAKGGKIETCDDKAAGAIPPAGGAVPVAVGVGAGGGLGAAAATVLTAAIVGTFTVIGNRVISGTKVPTPPPPCTPGPADPSTGIPGSCV